jgi:hypothetical protein
MGAPVTPEGGSFWSLFGTRTVPRDADKAEVSESYGKIVMRGTLTIESMRWEGLSKLQVKKTTRESTQVSHDSPGSFEATLSDSPLYRPTYSLVSRHVIHTHDSVSYRVQYCTDFHKSTGTTDSSFSSP